MAPTICQKAENACELFLDVICGPTQHINNTRIQVYVSGTPAGTSTMNMLHWEQGVLNPNFQMYDFGTEELNMKHYSSATPPQYDLTSIPHTFKIALFSGNHDYLADPTDVKRMVEEIPSESVVHHDIQDTYAHLDYTWAYDANDLIYNQVTDLLLQYKN